MFQATVAMTMEQIITVIITPTLKICVERIPLLIVNGITNIMRVSSNNNMQQGVVLIILKIELVSIQVAARAMIGQFQICLSELHFFKLNFKLINIVL